MNGQPEVGCSHCLGSKRFGRLDIAKKRAEHISSPVEIRNAGHVNRRKISMAKLPEVG